MRPGAENSIQVPSTIAVGLGRWVGEGEVQGAVGKVPERTPWQPLGSSQDFLGHGHGGGKVWPQGLPGKTALTPSGICPSPGAPHPLCPGCPASAPAPAGLGVAHPLDPHSMCGESESPQDQSFARTHHARSMPRATVSPFSSVSRRHALWPPRPCVTSTLRCSLPLGPVRGARCIGPGVVRNP